MTFDNDFNLSSISSKSENFFMFTNIVIESSKTEYFLKSKNFHHVKKLKFKNYINTFCVSHFNDDRKIDVCYDTKFEFSFVAANAIANYYPLADIHYIKKKKIRCQKIKIKSNQEFNKWMKLFIKNLTKNNVFIIMKKEFHIINQFFCSLVTKTDFMKSYNITSQWSQQNKKNIILIQKKHKVKIKAIKNFSPRAKKLIIN